MFSLDRIIQNHYFYSILTKNFDYSKNVMYFFNTMSLLDTYHIISF